MYLVDHFKNTPTQQTGKINSNLLQTDAVGQHNMQSK